MSKRVLRPSATQKQWPTKHTELRGGSRRQRREAASAQPPPSVDKLGPIVESSDDAIITKTLDGKITSWNRGAQRLYGYKVKEVIGHSIDLIIPPERSGEIREILTRIGRGERIEHFETIRLKKSGERVEVSVTISPLRNSFGKTVGASAIARDISKRKLREKETTEKLEATAEVLGQRAAQHTNSLNLLHEVSSAANKADT
ncbi:MAG: PAS domain S-box protein, partial [Acidiferrobacterales bacterium]|nr:PAS domain S-box protein [Acidiferrobacterales bacterium]